MFTESTALYDPIYMQFKDFEKEAARVAGIIRAVKPGARRILDVGCGTGEHARILSEQHGFGVDGVDIEPGFVEIAGTKHRGGHFVCADMVDLDMGRRYDAIICLFSSIAYLETLEAVTRALSRFRDHLEAGGVALVEPWIDPDDWNPGSIFLHTAETEDLTVCRMSHSSTDGSVSVLDFHYLVGTGDGVEHRNEVHRLGLFSREEMERAFQAADFGTVQFEPEGLIGRGLYIATHDARKEDST